MTDPIACPFCAYGKPKITTKRRGNYKRVGDNHQVLCGRCKARGPMVQDSETEAIRLWNERALIKPVTPSVRFAKTGCGCRTCRPVTLNDMRFVVCDICGNKRCPHATNHELDCTDSNEPGQPGSYYA